MKIQSQKLLLKAESPELDPSSFGLSAFDFKVNIGYDGKRAANNTTGLGNYSRSLIEHLSIQFPKNEYFVYTPKKKSITAHFSLFSRHNIHLRLPDHKKNTLFWRSFGIKTQLLTDKIDIFHGLSHEIPLGMQKTGIKSIVTIHDLIFLRIPAYYKLIDRAIYKLKSQYACKNADRIIAISERTKQDIIEFYGTDPAKIEVIYQSCDDSFKKLLTDSEKEEVRQEYQLPQKYLLNVGTIEARKNLMLIIKALPQIDPAYRLVVVGKQTPYAALVKEEITKLGLENRVIFLNNIPFNHLPAIYQMADIFIYPSRYEGFGIPIIEAMYGHVPVIAAKGSCLEEAGGPDSKYVFPDDTEALSTTVNQILANNELQYHMKQKGLEFVRRFDNHVVNQQVMDCYLKTLA